MARGGFGMWAWVGVFLVGLLALLAYQVIRRGYFLADDFVALNQLTLKQTSFTDNLIWFTRDWGIGADFYRPLVRLGYYFQYLFFGSNAAGWHLTSVALHIANSLLVFRLAYLLSRRAIVGTVAGLFFALQPIHTEPVAWISGQTDLWACFFCLLSATCFIQLRLEQRRTRRWLLRWNQAWIWLRIFSLVFFVFALLSKESGATLPIVLLAFEFVTGGVNYVLPGDNREPEDPDLKPQGGTFTRLLINHTPYWIILGSYIILRLAIFKGLGGYLPTGQSLDLPNFIRSNLRWLSLPFSLSGPDGLTLIVVVAAFVALTGVQEWEIFRSVLAFDSLRTAGFGLLWTLLFLLPALFVQPAERFTYLPSVGFALFFGGALAPFSRPKAGVSRFFELVFWLRLVSVVVVLVIFLATTNDRVQEWVDAGNTAQKILQNTQAVITKNNMPHFSYLYGENVPDDNGNAYIFRTGYPEAMQWLYHDTTLTAYKVGQFPIVENNLGQSIFLEYKTDGNVVNHYQVQAALQQRANNLKNEQVASAWNFAQGSGHETLAGWYVGDGAGELQLNDGLLSLNTSDAATLQNSNINLPAFQLGRLEITLKLTPTSTKNLTASASWIANPNTSNPPVESTPVQFNLIADGQYHTYVLQPGVLPYNVNGQLQGVFPANYLVTNLKLKFPAGSGTVEIQKVIQYKIPSTYSIPIG